jgi:glycerol transport system ATP-binding protein
VLYELVALILDGVSVRQRGQTWLDRVDLEFPSGLSTLIGPLGAGKTTLMRVAAGLQSPTTGRVLVNGQDVSSVSVRKRSVAFVYQQFINYPSLTVYDNIASPLRSMPRKEADARVREVASLMGLEDLLRRRPAELSGGQQQRTAIARALARPVDVLLLDEPLANLDYKLREQLRADLKTMFSGSQGVVIYSTADPAEALTFAAPTVVLGHGQVLHMGSVTEMYARPPTLEVARTLSDPPLNLLPGVVREGRIECLGASFPVPGAHDSERPVRLAVHPHQVSITRSSPEQLEFPAEIRLAEVTGSATFLHLLLADGLHLVAHLEGTRLFEPGEPATAFVDPAHIFVFSDNGELVATSAVQIKGEVDLHG